MHKASMQTSLLSDIFVIALFFPIADTFHLIGNRIEITRVSMADLASQPTSIQSVYSWYREDRLYVNRRYQRKLVWTLEEKQKLIESILKKYPIPAILVAEKEDKPGSFEIIDELQRLHAIVSFVETSFSSLDGKFFNLEFFGNYHLDIAGAKYSQPRSA